VLLAFIPPPVPPLAGPLILGAPATVVMLAPLILPPLIFSGLLVLGDLLFPRPLGDPPPTIPQTPELEGLWDIRFDERQSVHFGTGNDQAGNPAVWPPGSNELQYPARLEVYEWNRRGFNGVSRWWHVPTGYTQNIYAPQHQEVPEAGLLGINAITATWPNGISSTGQSFKNAAYGTPFGPWRTNTFYSEIRDFEIKPSGTEEEWQPWSPPVPPPVLDPPPEREPETRPNPPPLPVQPAPIPNRPPQREEPPIREPAPDPAPDPGPGPGPGPNRPPQAPPTWDPGPGPNRRPDRQVAPPNPNPNRSPRPVQDPPEPERGEDPETRRQQQQQQEVRPNPTPTTVVITDLGPIRQRLEDIPPTLDGISRKLAVMNAEINLLLRRAAEDPQPPEIDLQPILNALEEALKKDIPGTTYWLDHYCEKNSDGTPKDRMEFEVEDMPDPFAAIYERLNALAGMINESKKRKGFICGGKPTGQPVTVLFEDA